MNFRLCRNYLKGQIGDEINLLLSLYLEHNKVDEAYELLLLKRKFFLSRK